MPRCARSGAALHPDEGYAVAEAVHERETSSSALGELLGEFGELINAAHRAQRDVKEPEAAGT